MAETTITIKAKVASAQEELKKLSKSLKEVTDQSKEIATKSGIAFAALTGVIAVSVNEYAEAEAALNGLNSALANQGVYTGDLSKKYQELAGAIQKKTTFGDDEVIQGLALAQGYLGQIEATEELTEAAADLAAAQKIDLKQAFELIGKSVGTSKNALRGYGIEVDASGSKQEKLTQVVQGLNSKFAGQAEAATKGLGAFKQLKNSVGELFEAFGKQFAPAVTAAANGLRKVIDLIVENETAFKIAATVAAVATGFAALTTALFGSIAAFGAVTSALAAFNIALLPLSATIAGVAVLVTGLAVAWQTNFLGVQEITFGVFGAIKVFLNSFVRNISESFGGLGQLLRGVFSLDGGEIQAGADRIAKAFSDQISATAKAYRGAHQERLDQISKESQAASNDAELQKQNAEAVKRKKRELAEAEKGDREAASKEQERREQELLKGTLGRIKSEGIARAESSSEIQKNLTDAEDVADAIFQKTIEKIEKEKGATLEAAELKKTAEQELADLKDQLREQAAKAEEELLKKQTAARQKEIESLANNPIAAAFSGINPAANGENLAATGIGAADTMLKGKAGATSLLAGGAGAAANAFLPGSGAAVSSLFSSLSEGPEATKKMVREFIKSVPEIIEAVAESMPVVVEAFVDAMILDGGVIRIGEAIIRAMSGEAILKAIGKQIGLEVGDAFNADVIGKKLGDGVTNAFEAVGEKLLGWGNSFVEGVGAVFSNVGSVFENIFTNLGERLGIEFGAAFNPVVLGEKFAEGAGKLFKDVENVVQNVFKNLKAIFTDGLKGLFNTLPDKIGVALSKAGTTLLSSIKTGLADTFKPLKDAIDAMKSLFQPLIDALDSVAAAFGGGRGTGRGTDWSRPDTWAEQWGLARGGIIPKYANTGMVVPYVPRGTDTVPAMLTPGEMVLNAGQQRNLFDMIKSGGAPQEIVLRLEGRGFMQELIENALVKASATGIGRIRVAVGSES